MGIIDFIKSFRKPYIPTVGLGAIPSIFDERDRKYSDYISSGSISGLPNKYVTSYPEHVYNQYKTNMCVACSLALIRYIQTYIQTSKEINFDPLFIYANRDDPEYNYYKGEGMSPRDAVSIVRKFGDSIWNDSYSGFYDYNKAVKIFKAHAEDMIKEAAPYKIDSYYAITSVNDIKNAIISFGAVSTMFPVYKCLYKPKMDTNRGVSVVPFSILYRAQKIEGYHQMTIIGWDDDQWIVQNSWGVMYGVHGIVYIPMSYPTIESWAIIDTYNENDKIVVK